MQQKKKVRIEGYEMAYVDHGEGPAVVFLHGNPSSSFLWRHPLARLAGRYRCLAPDLMGMGDSDKLRERGDEAYSFARNRTFVDAWIAAVLPSEPVVLVMHDWGAALGLDWARRHPRRVRGVAYMEAVLGSTRMADLPPAAQAAFRAIQSADGEKLVLEDNVFLERMLAPGGFLVTPSDEVCAEYRRPFAERGEGRRPTLAWPRQLPFDGAPREICEVTDAARAWLAGSPVPKLFVDTSPGRLLVGALRDECARFPHQTRVTVKGLHYPQEDSPEEVTAALRDWLEEIRA